MSKNVRTISGWALVVALITLAGCQAIPAPTPTPLPPTPTVVLPTFTPVPPTPTLEPELWQQKAEMPVSVSSATASVVEDKVYGGSALLDGRVYLIGGYPPGSSDPTPIVDVYDPATDTWSQAADLPMPGADRASCVLAGRIYTISGWQRATTSPSRMVNLYDPAADEWQQGPDFPRPGHGHAAASVGNRIYVFGGSTTAVSQGVLWEYDPAR